MKKILIFISAIFILALCFGFKKSQKRYYKPALVIHNLFSDTTPIVATPGTISRSTASVIPEDWNLSARTNFFLPRFSDTSQANKFSRIDTLGRKIFTYDCMCEWLRTKVNGSKMWVQTFNPLVSDTVIVNSPLTSGNGITQYVPDTLGIKQASPTDSGYVTKELYDTLINKVSSNKFTSGHNADTLKTVNNGDENSYYVNYQSNGLIKPGYVVWSETGLGFYVTPSVFRIDTTYNSVAGTVTLPAADASFDRIDDIIVDTSGTPGYIQGVAASSPVAPRVNPSYQQLLTIVRVNAAQTIPAIDTSVIYNENTSPNWIPVTASGTTVNAANTSPVYKGTRSINVTNINNGDYLFFQQAAGDTTTISNFNALNLFLYNKASLPATVNLYISFYLGSNQITDEIPLSIQRSLSGAWQGTAVNISDFNESATVKVTGFKLRYSDVTSDVSSGFYLDLIFLSLGYSQAVPTADIVPDLQRVTDVDSVTTHEIKIDNDILMGHGPGSVSSNYVFSNGATNIRPDSTDGNVLIGRNVALNATAIRETVAIGDGALSSWRTSANLVENGLHVAIGGTAMSSLVNGNGNVSIGQKNLRDLTDGSRWISIGSHGADTWTTGYDNQVLGVSSGAGSGSDNVFLGNFISNRTGVKNYNTITGQYTARNLGNASYETYFGFDVAGGNSGGHDTYGNSGFGAKGSQAISTGANYNDGFGFQHLFNCITCSYNIDIGGDTTTINVREYSTITTAKQTIKIGWNINMPSATEDGQINIGNVFYARNATGIGSTVAGNIGLGIDNPLALVHLRAGTSALAPLLIPTGTALSTTVGGAIEHHSNHLWFTDANAGTRYQLDQQVTGTNTGDVTLAVIGSTPNANGASLSGQVLTIQIADSSFGGALSTTSQKISGSKDFLNNVGIGVVAPSEKLEIASGNIGLTNSQTVKVKDAGGTYRQMFFLDAGNNYGARNEAASGDTYYGLSNASNTTGKIRFQTAGNEIMTILNSGNVGISETAPTARLVVNGASGANTAIIKGASSSSYGLLVQAGTGSGDRSLLLNNYAGTQQFLMRGDGKSIIGTGTPDSVFTVTGGIHGTSGLRIDGLANSAASKIVHYNTATGTLSYADSTAAGSYATANNGVTDSSGRVILGGTLYKSTTIATSASQLIISTATSAVNPFLVQSTSGTAIEGQSSSSYGLVGRSTSGIAGQLVITPTSAGTVQPVFQLYRQEGGTATNGTGGSIDLYTHTPSQVRLSNQLIWKWTTATDATRTSQFIITGVNSGTTADKLTLSGNGALKLNAYGVGTFTGTPTYSLSTDASGNIIETGGPFVVAAGDLIAQTTTQNITTYTTPNTAALGVYHISADILITAVTGGVLTTTVTYTDETANSRTVTFYSMGTTTAGLSVTGVSNFAVMGEIVPAANTAITVTTTLTVGTATYNAHATIIKVRNYTPA